MVEETIEIVHNKNDWEKHRLCRNFDNLKRIEKVKNISYDAFFHQFMLQCVPVIIIGVPDDWECMNWTILNSDDGKRYVNYSYLENHINAKLKVPIADCRKTYFNSHEKIELAFSEFLSYWQQRSLVNYNDQQNPKKISDDLLYLKDWHLRRDQPNYQFYITPHYFAADWLNEYCIETNCDDYRFVYMGPKGTWTSFHVDVFSSFSWSTNIAGTKKWFLFPPDEENKLRDSLGNLPFDIDDENYQQMICDKNIRFFEVLQQAGETLFVPTGWHHQVWNIDDTISVNHNWFNACNIRDIWLAIQNSFNDILKEIDDCKDMDNFDDHCQIMLKSVFGLNFEMFFDILKCIVKNRQNVLGGKNELVLNEHKLGKHHAIFDLQAIYLILKDFEPKCHLEKFKEYSDSIVLEIDRILL